MQAWPRESCYCKMANARASKRPFEWSFIGNERRTRMDMAKVLREYFKDIPVFHDQNFDDLRELNGSKAVMVLRQLGWGGPRNSYWQVLANSKFSLCPCGNNPETHRFWESLWVGAIPIVERCEPDKNKYFHSLPPSHLTYLLVFQVLGGPSGLRQVHHRQQLGGGQGQNPTLPQQPRGVG